MQMLSSLLKSSAPALIAFTTPGGSPGGSLGDSPGATAGPCLSYALLYCLVATSKDARANSSSRAGTSARASRKGGITTTESLQVLHYTAPLPTPSSSLVFLSLLPLTRLVTCHTLTLKPPITLSPLSRPLSPSQLTYLLFPLNANQPLPRSYSNSPPLPPLLFTPCATTQPPPPPTTPTTTIPRYPPPVVLSLSLP